jgi:hypothetical protein
MYEYLRNARCSDKGSLTFIYVALSVIHVAIADRILRATETMLLKIHVRGNRMLQHTYISTH